MRSMADYVELAASASGRLLARMAPVGSERDRAFL